MKRILIILLLAVSQAFAGNVTGVVQTAGGNPISNGTLGFTPTTAAVVVGQFVQTASTVNCYTDNFGNVVGIPNPLTLPVVVAGNAGSLTASTTYYIQFTFYNSGNSTESVPSPELAFTLSPGNSSISITAFGDTQFGNATGYKVYASTTSGAEKLQQTVVGFGGTGFGSLLSVTSPPSSNNSICSFNFSDSLIPQATYSMSITDSNGSSVPGFPEVFYMQGSSFNLNTAFPTANTDAIFPQAIVSQPSGNAIQSIHSDLTLNGFHMSAGGYTATGDYLNTALATMKWGFSGLSSPDVGLSRCGVGTLCLGNGKQGDFTGTLKFGKSSVQMEDGFKINVEVAGTWGAALALCPSTLCVLNGQSPFTPTAIGTIPCVNGRVVHIYLSAITFTQDHIEHCSGLLVQGSGIENIQGTKIQAIGTGSPFPMPTTGTQAIQGEVLGDFELEATAGNSAQDGISVDLTPLGAGSVWEFNHINRVTTQGFKGSAVHLKGLPTSGTVAIQGNVIDTHVCVVPSGNTTVGACLRVEGGEIGQNYYLNNWWGLSAVSGTTNAYLGVTNTADTFGPYSQWFEGTTIQGADLGVLFNGCQACTFRDTHAEIDLSLFKVKTPTTWHNNKLLLDGGVANGNVGVNSGAGRIVDASDSSNTFGTTVELSRWSFEGTPDKIATCNNGTNVIIHDISFDQATPSMITTGCTPGYSTSTTTFNSQNSPTAFVNGCSGGTVTTLTSGLGVNETLTLLFNASCTLAVGGNIVLGGYPGTLVFNAGEWAQFKNTDQSGGNLWNLISTTAGRSNGFFSSPGRTTALTSTIIYATGAADTLYLITVHAVCKTTVAAATVTPTLTYTDPSGTVQGPISLTAATCTALGTSSTTAATSGIEVKGGTNISIAATIAGSPNYDIRASVTKLGGN